MKITSHSAGRNDRKKEFFAYTDKKGSLFYSLCATSLIKTDYEASPAINAAP